MARTKTGRIVSQYPTYGYVVYDYGPDKSPRFELYDNKTKKSLAKSDNPYDFDPLVFGEEWAERNDWYEIHGKSAPKKRRIRKSNQDS